MKIVKRHFEEPLLKIAMDSSIMVSVYSDAEPAEMEELLKRFQIKEIELSFYDDEEVKLAKLVALNMVEEDEDRTFFIFGKPFKILEDVEEVIETFNDSEDLNKYRKMVYILQDFLLWEEKNKDA